MAAACRGLEQHIINLDRKPLCNKNSTFLESLSPLVKQVKSFSQFDHLCTFSRPSISFPPSPSPSTSPSFLAYPNAMQDEFGLSGPHVNKNGSLPLDENNPYGQKRQYKHSDSFSSVNSDNLSTCTEGLGLESFNEVDEFLRNEIVIDSDNNRDRQSREEGETRGLTKNELKRSRSCGMGQLPPPISCIGKCGKPFVSFKSFRQDGRFILKEIRIPELMHAYRENGRLKLQFIQSDDDDGDDEDNDDEAFDENGKEENVEKI